MLGVRGRLTVWYTAVVAVVLIVFSAISYIRLARDTRAATDAALVEEAQEFAAALARGSANAIKGNEIDPDFRSVEREIILFRDGQLVAWSRLHLTSADRQRVAATMRRTIRGFATLAGGPEDDGIRAYAMPVQSDGHQYVVVVAKNLDEQADRLDGAAHAVFFGIPIALVLAAGGGYLLARKALRPVAVMSRKARQIGAETLAERIPVPNERDELGFLAVTLNDLLERLQRTFELQRRFMADASHELRTPVAIIQGEADVTLSRDERSAAEYRESIRVMQKAALKLTRIVESLFLLARADAGGYPVRKTRFYLDEAIAECVRSMRNIAAGRGVTLEQSSAGDVVLFADEELIHRMILNLVDNAVKFTPSGGKVSIDVSRDSDRVVIRVTDSGPGIAPADQPRIFERFYRIDRTANEAEAATGAGLGLPIARWIAEAHGGTLQLEGSDERGSTFTIELPATE